MKKKLRSYQEKLLEDLRDAELAHRYLNEALADEDPRMVLLALKNIQDAQGGYWIFPCGSVDLPKLSFFLTIFFY